MRKILPALPIAVLALSLAGCRGDEAPAVARVAVSPRAFRLAYPQSQMLHLEWQPSAPLAGLSVQPMVFLHLRDEKNHVVRTFDHPLPQRWQEGTPQTYDARVFQSVLAPPLPAGRYTLTLGLYEGKTRWPLDGVGKRIDKREYAAVDVEVPAGTVGPGFAFTPSWLPPEPGGDRFVVARRWLNGRGAIGLRDLKESGSVWLLLRIPSGKEPNETLAVESGGVPSVLVRGTCGGMETSLSGPGMHEVELPVEPPANGVCRITFVPNFTLTSAVTGQVRSVSLENAAWAPAAAGQPATGQP
jgi:hypothetical protein